MLIYKKTEETVENLWGKKETAAKKITVYFLGIPIYRNRYKLTPQDLLYSSDLEERETVNRTAW